MEVTGGATLRHPVGDRPGRPLTCGSDGRTWRRDRPGGLPPGCWRRPLVVSRHTTPLVGLPSGANLMRRVMYTAIADNVPILPPSRLWSVHQLVMRPRIGFSGPLAARLAGSQAHHSCLLSRSSAFSIPYPNCGWGHGGTRNKSTSRSVQTCSVSPAAIAGVCGRHCLAETVPLVGSDSGSAWRKEACGRQKL